MVENRLYPEGSLAFAMQTLSRVFPGNYGPPSTHVVDTIAGPWVVCSHCGQRQRPVQQSSADSPLSRLMMQMSDYGLTNAPEPQQSGVEQVTRERLGAWG